MANVQIYPADSSNPTDSVMDPPPVYTANDVAQNDPPPSYDSLFGKFKQAKAESTGNVDFARKCCSICTGSVIFIVILALLLGYPIAMIVMGAIYLDDCPAQRLIPIYLIVDGVFTCISILYGLLKSALKDKEKEGEGDGKNKDKPKSKGRKAGDCLESLINTFLFAWFICGNVFTYNLDWVSSPVTAKNYCDPTIYYFCFWTITVTYILVGVIVLVACCICVCACVAASKK
ncbi:transmembrane protein 272-like [Saccostrea cucullata]|uniref:transmembrane protein 272-like n=1 Tax=Saccostrea cuccullata TaxID=36930 RepID=UPI002ED30BD4